jgi:hypothetical protein
VSTLNRGFESRTHRQFDCVTGLMPDAVKVPEDEFKAIIRALLKMALMPASGIEGKPGAKRPGPKKRG